MNQPILLAYLDHNVLNTMLKGDPHSIGDLLKKLNLTPVFSDENLAEIHRSKGYEERFLNHLERIDALYLSPILDAQLKHTGEAEFQKINPFDAYKNYVENMDDIPESDFGFKGMLQKLYGGLQDRSFEEIFASAAKDIDELIEEVREELQGAHDASDQVSGVEETFKNLQEGLREQFGYIGTQLDAEPRAGVVQFQEATQLGPLLLNNVKGPDVVRKIWALLESSFPADIEVDIETFLGIKPFSYEADADRERTRVEKVNGIYHQLNFLGYYRDSGMKNTNRLTASLSDMTHAGLASFCHVLICRDERFVMKASAAYEYLGVGPLILHYRDNVI